MTEKILREHEDDLIAPFREFKRRTRVPLDIRRM